MEKILYFGKDEPFFDFMKEYYGSLVSPGKLECIAEPYEQTKFIEKFFKHRPSLIIVDFCYVDYEESLRKIIEDILLLRDNKLTSVVPIVGLFSSKEKIKQSETLLGCGLVHTLIKGEGERTFLQDIFYIAFEQELKRVQFATAININLNHSLRIFSSISRMSADEIYIDTDLDFETGDSVHINTQLFDDFNCKDFIVDEVYKQAVNYDYLESIKVKIPYPGPWEEIAEDSIQRDTVETWVDFNSESLLQPRNEALIVNQKGHGIDDIFNFISKAQSKIKIKVKDINEDWLQTIKIRQPFLIVFELNYQEGEQREKDFDALSMLIESLKLVEGYYPVVFAFNYPSTSQAGQKAYNYGKFLASKDNIDSSVIQKLINASSSKLADIEGEYFTFSHDDSRRVVEIDFPITVNTMNEHEMTFYSPHDLPMYSVLKLDVPTDLYMTIVPPIRDIPRTNKGKGYMGIIHGCHMDDRKILRQFINTMIFSPIKEFKFEEEKQVKKAKQELDRDGLQSESDGKIVDSKQEDINEQKESEVFRKRKYKGRSKL